MPKSAILMISVNNLRLNFSTTKKLNHFRQTCYVNLRFAFPNLLVLNKGHLHDVHYILTLQSSFVLPPNVSHPVFLLVPEGHLFGQPGEFGSR